MTIRRWSRRRVTRRRFLQTMGGSAAALTLVACGQPPPATQENTTDEAEEADEPTSTPAAGEPQRSGTLRVAFPGSPANLDPALGYTVEQFMLSQALYERLTQTYDAMTVEPLLATAWEASDDGLSWTFTLREGVTFHDGSPFGAEDVVYTFERLLDPDLGSSALSVLSFVSGVTAVDDLTVRFDLERPSVDFPLIISFSWGGIIPRNSSDEELAEQPVGTGVFQFAEFLPGERLRVVRNEEYWQPDLPYLDELEFNSIPEAVTRLEALNSDAVGVIWNLSLEQVSIMEDNPDLQLQEIPEASFQPIVLNQKYPPLDDNRVREALKLCVDREGILQAAAQGRGTIANDQLVPPWYNYHADLALREQDFAQARELLAEAGYADGLTLDMVTSSIRPGMLEISVAFQEMVQQAGITINLERLSIDTYWGEYLNYPLAVSNGAYTPPVLTLCWQSSIIRLERGTKQVTRTRSWMN